MLKNVFVIVLAILFSQSLATAEDNLFPNDSLDDWYIVGPQVSFTVKGGVLTGEGKERRNSFLTSKKTYGDFKLSVEVKIIKGNSGIQIRSHDIDNRLVGYQIETDPSRRAWSGGLYDEGRRAWLQPPNEDVRDAFKLDEWNLYEITCIGPRIKATVNGKVTTNFMDFMDLDGHIGFQIHSGDSKVMWRNACIVDSTKMQEEAPNKSLEFTLQNVSPFDGETLNGMDPVGGGIWTVEDGAIVGRQSAVDHVTGLMWIKEPYDEFALKFKFKIDRGNSGFFFRSQQIPNDNTGIRGIQVEVDRKTDCGGLYESGGRGWLSMPTERYCNYDDWNDMMVYTCGTQVMVWLNNKLLVDCDTSPQMKKPGTEVYKNNFAFQLHKRQDVEVRFKDIELMIPSFVDEDGDTQNKFLFCEMLQ